jgi:glutamate dehydrogenase/leucine dehydrogenase
LVGSLYHPLIEEGLTTLKIRYDYRTDKEYIIAAKEWEEDIDWSEFNRTFYTNSLLTENDLWLNNKQTRELFAKYGQTEYLNEVFALLRKGKFHGLDCYYSKYKDIRFIANLHSTNLGVNSKDYALYTGGIRRHTRDEKEIEVIKDGLNLGRAQSFKNALAKLHWGGGKITVIADEVDLNDKKELGFLAFAIDRVKFTTGPDMRYPVELADVLKEYSAYISAGSKNPIGPSGPPTAWGVHKAMNEAIKFHFGKRNAKGMKVAVMGLGSVGYSQAEFLIEDGAELIVCDINEELSKKLVTQYPYAEIEVVNYKDILDIEADILVPSAIGGFLTEEVINRVKFCMIFGGANNQLFATNKEEEIRLAGLLKERGILYQECWIQNIGGVISGMEMYTKGDKADKVTTMDRIGILCAEITRNNLNGAAKLNITPTEHAYNTIEGLIFKC